MDLTRHPTSDAPDSKLAPSPSDRSAAPRKLFSERLAGGVVSGRWIGLSLGIALFIWAALSPGTAPVGRSVEQLFGTQDVAVADYRAIKRIFGDRETILVVYRDRELFAPDGRGLARLARLSQDVAKLEQVDEVLSLDRLEGTLRLISAVLYPGSQAEWALLDRQNEIAQAFVETFDGWTHRRSNDLVVLVCLISSPAQQVDPDRTRATIRSLRALIRDIPEAHVVGEPVMVEDALEYLQRDGRWLQFGSLVLLGLVILVVLRTIRWLLVAACVVIWSNTVTTWLLASLSFQQSMISSLLGSIIAVIGVATTVHLVVGYRSHRLSGASRTTAMRSTIERLLPPIFWACLTDAAGFAALATAQVRAVQEFGWMMALASLVTLSSVCLLVPGLILCGPRDWLVQGGLGQPRLEAALARILAGVRRRPGQVCGLTLGLALVTSIGFYYARVETDFTKNFRTGTPIMEGYHFAETEFGGAGLIEIAIPTPRALERRFLERVADFQTALRRIPSASGEGEVPSANAMPRGEPTEPALAKVISLVDVWLATRRFPPLRLLPADTIVGFMRQVLPQFTSYWYQWDADRKIGYLRIFARTKQQQTASEKRALIESVRSLAEDSFGDRAGSSGAEVRGRAPRVDSRARTPVRPPAAANSADLATPRPPYLVSGLFVLLARIVDSLLADHVATTTVAILSIGGLMYAALRSLRLVLIGLVPNLLPIFVLLGSLGWLGIPINMGVAMIAAVSIGLSVDSSIHYLWAVARREQDSTRGDESLAVEWAQQRIGTALTYSTIALVVGFVSLTSSQFVPTIYFGALVSAAMVGGLAGNVVLLPAMLALRVPRRADASRSSQEATT